MSKAIQKIKELNEYVMGFETEMDIVHTEYNYKRKIEITEGVENQFNIDFYGNKVRRELNSILNGKKSYKFIPRLFKFEVDNDTYDKEIFNEYMNELQNLNDFELKQAIENVINDLRCSIEESEECGNLIDLQINELNECIELIDSKDEEFSKKYKVYNDLIKEVNLKLEQDNSFTIHEEVYTTFDYKSLKPEALKRIKNVAGFFSTTRSRCEELIWYRYLLLNTLSEILYRNKQYFEKLMIRSNSFDYAIYVILNSRKDECIREKLNNISDNCYSVEDKQNINKIISNFKAYIHKLVIGDFIMLRENSNFVENETNKDITLAIIDNPVYIMLNKKISNYTLREEFNNFVERFELESGYSIKKVQIEISLDESLSIFFDNKHRNENVKSYINSIICNLTCGVFPGGINNILIDTSYAGKYFTDFNEVRKLNDKIFGKKIFTDSDELNDILTELNDDIIEITHNKLGNKYDNIYQYNIENEDSMVPIRIISIIGLANILEGNIARKLINIATNGSKCGINLLIDYEEEFESRGNKEYIEKIKSSMMVINVDKDEMIIDGSNLRFNDISRIMERIDLDNRLQYIAKEITLKEKIGFNLESIGNDSISSNAAEEIIIPIGKNNRGEVQSISFGKGVSHHGLIAGQTGSGKSTLLHTIILSAIKNYGPNDLNIYLMDFKEGIEFKVYSENKIPHIKLIALESQVEFGESILEFMVEEIQNRGKLFKSNGVENLKGYKAKTGMGIPRILLIIDEFTNLFNITNGREVTMNNSQLMKKIILQGRAFGINVLMASQSIRDTSDSTLSDETIEQMAVRIGLKCTEKDSAALMGSDNTELNKIGSEIGAAIYNNENGRGENLRFKIAYADNNEREKIIKDVEEKYIDQFEDYQCRVFDGNDSANVEDDIKSVFNYENDIKKIKKYHEIWIGEPIKIGDTVSVKFTQGLNNLIVISNKYKQINKIIIYSIMSIVRQVRMRNKESNEIAITLLDYNYNLCENSKSFNTIVEGNKDLIETMDNYSAKFLVDKLYKEFVKRRDNNEFNESPRYLIVNGIQRARDLLAKSVSNNFTFSLTDDDNEETENLGVIEMFETLVNEGGDYGIFLIATSDTYKNYNRFIDKIGYWFKESMNLRIAFNMNGDDGERFIGESSTENLNENTAIIYDDSTGLSRKFRVYTDPTEKWIKEKYTNL